MFGHSAYIGGVEKICIANIFLNKTRYENIFGKKNILLSTALHMGKILFEIVIVGEIRNADSGVIFIISGVFVDI